MDFFTIVPYFISKLTDYDLVALLFIFRVIKLNKITKKLEDILEL